VTDPLELDDLNVPRVPHDAGEYADDLRRLLGRIPRGWGRWISCGPGWYPLLVRLNKALAALVPEYEVHQVKEKYGTLRYYIGFPTIEPVCCEQLHADDPRPFDEAVRGPLVPAGRSPETQRLLDEWFERHMEHLRSPEHIAAVEALAHDPRVLRRRDAGTLIEELIREAELEAARTCESCGAAGSLMIRDGWYQTLCDPCGEKLEYARVSDIE
jgi:hypothetical protein